MKNKDLVTLLVIGGIGYWLYKKYFSNQPSTTIVATNVAPVSPYADIQNNNVDPSLNISKLTGQTVYATPDSANVKWQLSGIGKKLGKIPNIV